MNKKILFFLALLSLNSFSNIKKPIIGSMDYRYKKSTDLYNKMQEEKGDIDIQETESNENIVTTITYSQQNNFKYNGKYDFLNKKLDQLIYNSKTFLGTPYVWGGNGRNGIDCSAFVKSAYASLGLVLPRVSRDQAKVGRPVSLMNIKKGDLVFFETDKKRPGVISHVGMYIGNGLIIHASSSFKKVVIVPFNDNYFMTRLRTVKRIVEVKA